MKFGAFAILCLAALPVLLPADDGQLRFAPLGDFKLESGEVIRDCKVGYRTFGQIAGDRSNVVLVPTWFAGTSEDLRPFVGPGKLVDTSKHFAVVVDSLGNGISSSPSNSRRQPRMRFPDITLRDMVNSQYLLLTEVLHLQRVKAVVGISMGGMQAFEWIVAYPEFVEKAVPISGSPRLSAYDSLLWQSVIGAVRSDPTWRGGNYTRQPAREVRFTLGALLFTTPQRYNRTTKREDVSASIAAGSRALTVDANDTIRQAEAMLSLDVSKGFGGSMQKAASRVKAEALVIVSKTDRVVAPGPALEFAALTGAEVLELEGDCGHLAFECEQDVLTARVNAFLAK
jgi:homoserine O-acetyltransferase